MSALLPGCLSIFHYYISAEWIWRHVLQNMEGGLLIDYMNLFAKFYSGLAVPFACMPRSALYPLRSARHAIAACNCTRALWLLHRLSIHACTLATQAFRTGRRRLAGALISRFCIYRTRCCAACVVSAVG